MWPQKWGRFFVRRVGASGLDYNTLQTKCARKAKSRSMKTPPTQIRKFAVILGSLICFLSILQGNGWSKPDISGAYGRVRN